MKKLFIALLFVSAVLLTGCPVPYNPVPNTHVDFTIYPNDVMYYKLNTYGGYEYFTGGVNGIVIYRLDEWTFLAYDRACPYDWEEPDSRLFVAPDGLRLVDSLCGSTYNILDGGVLSGPATYPARRYNTRYDGMKLRVYNGAVRNGK